MSSLVRFLLVNLAIGFAAGIVVGLGFLQSIGDLSLLVREPLAGGLILWGFASAIAMGAIGTALALMPTE